MNRLVGNFRAKAIRTLIFDIGGIAFQYESFDNENFSLEIEDVSLYYNPMFNRESDRNFWIYSPEFNPFVNLGASFYEIESKDYETMFSNVSYEIKTDFGNFFSNSINKKILRF